MLALGELDSTSLSRLPCDMINKGVLTMEMPIPAPPSQMKLLQGMDTGENITEHKRYKAVIMLPTIHPGELICERTYI